MKKSFLLLVLALAACGTAVREPVPAGAGEHRHATPDVAFMQGMIVHHAQALEMTRLVPARAGSEEVRRLSERMDVSQQDEIALMANWLRQRGQEPAGAHALPGDGGHAGHTPGMHSREEMDRLAAARGVEFDRLFLEMMIRHHEGALAMVAALFGSRGAAQDSDVYQLASDVDADQRMEISRMRELLGRLPAR